jgi:hypothetical protein
MGTKRRSRCTPGHQGLPPPQAMGKLRPLQLACLHACVFPCVQVLLASTTACGISCRRSTASGERSAAGKGFIGVRDRPRCRVDIVC